MTREQVSYATAEQKSSSPASTGMHLALFVASVSPISPGKSAHTWYGYGPTLVNSVK